MNEQLQMALARLIDTLIKSIDGATGQVPDLVRQLIEYQAFRSWIWMAWYVALMAVGILYWAWYGYKITKGNADRWGETATGWGIAFAIFAIVLCLVGTINLILEWITYIQLTQYPNTWVLDYLRSMIK